MTQKGIPSAFPVLDTNGEVLFCRDSGMTLRDWFAGQALTRLADLHSGKAFAPYDVAKAAYTYADEMLTVRGE